MNILVLILGIILPPLGAAIKLGNLGTHFWINLVLTLLGYVPGLCHFLWMMFTDKELD